MSAIDTPVVLIVEDDPPVRGLIIDVLQDEGYQVVAVHDGTLALQVLDSLKVDLITLDLDLPGLTGSELLEVLQRRKIKIPPVIVVTSTKPVRRLIKQMAQVVITKPFDVDALLAAVLEQLPPRARRVTATPEQISHIDAEQPITALPEQSLSTPAHRALGEAPQSVPNAQPRPRRRSKAGQRPAVPPDETPESS